jgi:hypothetical protein
MPVHMWFRPVNTAHKVQPGILHCWIKTNETSGLFLVISCNASFRQADPAAGQRN